MKCHIYPGLLHLVMEKHQQSFKRLEGGAEHGPRGVGFLQEGDWRGTRITFSRRKPHATNTQATKGEAAGSHHATQGCRRGRGRRAHVPAPPPRASPHLQRGRLMNTNDRPVPRRGVFNTSHVSVTLSDHLPKPGSGSPSVVPRRAARR